EAQEAQQGELPDENTQVDSQKTMDFDVFCRGVRLDILFRGETTWYNIEMQCGKYYDIPLRSRYYGSHMDMEQLPKGGKYTQLKTTYVIFICTFDLYGLNEPVYSFENFDQKNGLKFGDKTYKIIVNTKSTKKDIPKELKALFRYINENEIDEGDGLICDLDKEVTRLNREDDEWRRQAMRLDEEIELRAEFSKREGIAEGIETGTREERNKIAKTMLADHVPFDAIQKYTGVKEDVLKELEQELFQSENTEDSQRNGADSKIQ
ncbi:MAG: Rpn family recombination-promoting nuclease/putative transposase, partial [Bacillota bacterium]|nr:Rpn family recombination-promoting nuclease/putative transposase [Bacillota bacterium]